VLESEDEPLLTRATSLENQAVASEDDRSGSVGTPAWSQAGSAYQNTSTCCMR